MTTQQRECLLFLVVQTFFLVRTEMAKIQDKMSQSPQAQNIANVSPQGLCDSDIRKIETDLTFKISGMEERINETDSNTRAKICELSDGIQDIRKAQEINESSTRDKITHLEQQLISAPPSNEATEVSPPSAPITKQPPAQEDENDLKLFVLQTVEATKDLVRSPLSVIFDAVRSEDFVGEDNFLTFSKVRTLTFLLTYYIDNCICIEFFCIRQTLTWAKA